jgi:hypothetical protein
MGTLSEGRRALPPYKFQRSSLTATLNPKRAKPPATTRPIQLTHIGTDQFAIMTCQSIEILTRWNSATTAKITPATTENVFILHPYYLGQLFDWRRLHLRLLARTDDVIDTGCVDVRSQGSSRLAAGIVNPTLLTPLGHERADIAAMHGADLLTPFYLGQFSAPAETAPEDSAR